jgi:hypothetical protein
MPQAQFATPRFANIQVGRATPSGTVNVGDWLAYSGQSVVATNAGHTAYWKASGVGIALEANPTFDSHGRSVQNTALLFQREGVVRVSAAFSGQPAYGVGLYPVSTGSGVAAPTGLTGVGSTWQTGIKLFMSGATGAGGSGVAQVVEWFAAGNGGTGQVDALLLPPRPDYF